MSNIDNSLLDLSTINHIGDIPGNRFGHTLIKITKTKVCLFGGSVGDSKKLNYNNDTFTYNILTKIWQKIKIKDNNTIPISRAAHAACNLDEGKMAIYGGSIANGGLADDILNIFELNKDNETEGEWSKIETKGETPGQRYGHSLNYLKPYVILFGGNLNPILMNDLWLMNLEHKEKDFYWIKINVEKKEKLIPMKRLYHSSCVCQEGKYKEKLIIFGGRNEQNKPLNDLWILNIKLEEEYPKEKFEIDWTELKPENKDEFIPRINHSMLFYKYYLFILGGKNSNQSPLSIEVFDMEKKLLYKYKKIRMNRHASFIFEKNIYLFGGFIQKNPLPLGDMYLISLNDILKNSELQKIIIDNNNMNKISINNNENNKVNYLLSNEVVIGSDKKIFSDDLSKEPDDLSLFRKLNISKLNDENKRVGDLANSENPLIYKKNIYNNKLIEKFLFTLLRPLDWFDNKVMSELTEKFPFEKEEILYLTEEVIKIISKEKSLIKIRSPCKIFGNLYGIYTDLMRYFESYGNPSDNIQNGDINVMQYIFLGDFCDRGNQSLEIILLLFALKIKYPDFIYIIRGHHEDIDINEHYGLGDECKEKLNEDIYNDNSIFKNINQVFDFLPFGVLVDINILCIHSGLGSSIDTLDDISNIPRPIKVNKNPEKLIEINILDLLYSEFDNEEDDLYCINTARDKNKKGFFINYGKKKLDEFTEKNNINLIISSHTFVKEGFCTYCDDKLLNIFSCTNYMDKSNNIGAMIIIGKKAKNKNANIMPKLIGVNENKNKKSQFEKIKVLLQIKLNN